MQNKIRDYENRAAFIVAKADNATHAMGVPIQCIPNLLDYFTAKSESLGSDVDLHRGLDKDDGEPSGVMQVSEIADMYECGPSGLFDVVFPGPVTNQTAGSSRPTR